MIIDGITTPSGTVLDVSELDALDSSVAKGTVLQVLQNVSDQETNPGAGWSDIAGATISIQPTSATSKILINFTSGGMSQGASNDIGLRLYRDSTVVRSSTRYGYGGDGFWSSCPLSLTYLDAPASSSTVVYKIQILTALDNDFRINSNQVGHGGVNGLAIIATEIGA